MCTFLLMPKEFFFFDTSYSAISLNNCPSELEPFHVHVYRSGETLLTFLMPIKGKKVSRKVFKWRDSHKPPDGSQIGLRSCSHYRRRKRTRQHWTHRCSSPRVRRTARSRTGSTSCLNTNC